MSNFFVSVIIPTYNRANFLKECMDSILEQSYQNFELIVVDDGSEDRTQEILSSYKRIKVISSENKGVSHARNLGIKNAKYDLIAFCDSDDLWQKDKLKIQIDFLRSHKNAVVCYTDEIWIRNGRRVNACKHHQKSSGWIFERSLHLCLVSPSSVMMKREFFEKIGNFDEAFYACEDYDLWLRASLAFPFYFIEEPLIIKRGGHADQLSQKYWGMDRFRIKAIVKCLQEDLSDSQRIKALEVLQKKCNILANGAMKRKKFEEAEKYKALAKYWLQNRSC